MTTATLLLLVLTATRLAVAAWAPLAPDEAYYWIWSRVLQAGYLDHPPMVALWIRAGTVLAGQTALGVRLLGPLAALAGSLLLMDAAERLYPGRGAGVRAAALLNATLMVGAGAVTMTPDTPLLFFITVALWALARVKGDGRWWLVVGLAGGAALDSKYTGGFLGLGVLLWLVGTRQWREFGRPLLWAGGAVALVAFLPVLDWNAAHGWASLAKQGGRVGDWRPARAVQFLGELVGGQVGLATPGVFALFAAGLWRAGRTAVTGDRASALLLALSLPGLLVFAQHALGDRVQANWLAVLYPPLAVLGGAVRVRWWRMAAGLGLVVTGLAYLQATAAPFPLPRQLDPTLIRMAGWPAVAAEADAMRRQRGLGFVAAEDYSLAAALAWSAPPGTTVLGVDSRWDLFALPAAWPESGLLVQSERRQGLADAKAFTEIKQVGTLVRSRDGVEAERFRVYSVRLRAAAPAVTLPRPGGSGAEIRRISE